MPSAPHLDFAGEIRAGDPVPDLSCRPHSGRRHRAACDRVRQGRHGRHDARPHDRSAHRAEDHREARGRHPSLRRRQLLPRPHLSGRRRLLHPQRRDRPRRPRCRTTIAKAGPRRKVVVVGAGPAGWRPRASRRTRPRGRRVRGGERARRPDAAHRPKPAPQGDDRHHRLAHGAMRGDWASQFRFNACAEAATSSPKRPTS